ncbi:MAG: HlyD family efflux transporter periplasmic adaptor subunit [Gammaproteobacteria bacterium]|nr:HlyD family efflux transporter periplasmic adaptor subunit [Gammaproteobacteria bacterium]
MTTGLFRKEAIEHNQEKSFGEVILSQPLSFYVLTFSIFLITLIAIILLIYGSYARRVSVNGYIVPDKGLVKLYAPTQGELYEDYVAEGKLVKKDDVLFSVKTLKSNKDGNDSDALLIDELKQQKESLTLKLNNEEQLTQLKESHLNNQIIRLNTEIKQLAKGIELQQSQLKLANDELKNLQTLRKKGYISDVKLTEGKRAKLALQVTLESTLQREIQLRNQLAELSEQIKKIPHEWLNRKLDLSRTISEIDQRLVEVSGRREYTIKAPLDGQLTALQAFRGQTLDTRTPLAAILPEDSVLRADLFLPTRAIGFVAKGQKVLLRYDAFPYQHYGVHEGRIADITQVILSPTELPVPIPLDEPVYRVTVDLKSQFINALGKEFSLQAGMLLKADIVLEERSLSQWLFEPLYRLKGITQ